MNPQPSRFARALQAYFAGHSQGDLAIAAGIERSVLSRISNGARRASQDTARSIITGTPLEADRIKLLTAWLEDQIPENCRDIVSIIASQTDQHVMAASILTEQDRAIAWLHEQLQSNVHAVAAIVDLWRASGSPDPRPSNVSPMPYNIDPAAEADKTALRVAADAPPPS